MRKVKYFVLISVILGGLVFLFGPEVLPENQQFYDFLHSAPKDDVIIIFNSGGWGNTPFEKAKDFAPIVEETQKTLNEWGYNSVVIPYTRTKDSFLGEIAGAKEMFQLFPNQAEKLSKEINEFLIKNPGKKIVIAGLSNGAVFVNETTKRISQDVKNQIYAVEIGSPFWEESSNFENTLRLDNGKKDPLAAGEMKTLIPNLFKASFRWVLAKISGRDLTFSKALQLPGHEYFWPEIESDVVSFLGDKLR